VSITSTARQRAEWGCWRPLHTVDFTTSEGFTTQRFQSLTAKHLQQHRLHELLRRDARDLNGIGP
jgi:succinate dehydrogenase flavin-adding protein (antitoxin of CptAB toxin-antitoxin module)